MKKLGIVSREKITLHESIYWLVFFLTAFGLLMSFSTTSTTYFTSGNPHPLNDFAKQGLFAIAGFFLIGLIRRLPLRLWKKWALPYYLFTCALLVLVLIPPFYLKGIYNESGEAARRWLNLGFFSFQPSELVKLGVILVIARVAEAKKGKINGPTFFKLLVLVFIPTLLIYFQPNFSTASIVLLLGASAMIVAATPISYFILSSIPLVLLGIVAFFRSDRLMNRIASYQNVFKDPSNTGYQVLQSYIAIARGGWFGQGLQRSSQKFYSLPEAETDFIFSIICEEFGFLLALLLVLMYFGLFYLALRVSLKAKESFHVILAGMIGIHLFLQAMMHVAVTLGLLPPTGIPLPFVSIGGTALVIYLVEAGILIRIAQSIEDA